MASAAAPPRRPSPNPNGDARRDRRVRKEDEEARERRRATGLVEKTRGRRPPPASRAPGPRRAGGGAARARVGARVWLAESRVEGDEGGWVPHRVEMALPEGVETWVFGEWSRAACGFVLPASRIRPSPRGTRAGTRRPRRRRSRRTGTTTETGAWTRRRTRRIRRRALLRRRPSPRPAFRSRCLARGTPQTTPRGRRPRTSATRTRRVARRRRVGTGARPRVTEIGRRRDARVVRPRHGVSRYAIDPAAADALARHPSADSPWSAWARRRSPGNFAGDRAWVWARASFRTRRTWNRRRARRLNASVAGSVDGGTDRARRRPGDGFSATLRVGDSRAETRAGSPTPPPFEVFARNPRTYVASPRVEASWQRVTWISGAPHVRAKVVVADDALAPGATPEAKPARPGTATTRAGSTGGSSDCPSARGDGRRDRLRASGGGVEHDQSYRRAAARGVLSGPGEDRSRLARVDPEVVTGRLARVEFRGATFETVRALTHVGGDPPDLASSPHCDGALCADLFRGAPSCWTSVAVESQSRRGNESMRRRRMTHDDATGRDRETKPRRG